jgi:uncharacterized protein
MKKKTKKFTLSVLPEILGICHFGKNAPLPEWATHNNDFFSITKTHDELSIVCLQEKIPENVTAERGWRAFKVKGPLGFVMTGIVSSLSSPLAEAEISILYISTFETDYVLVEEENLEKAERILSDFCEIE